jgi:hypothetical protein
MICEITDPPAAKPKTVTVGRRVVWGAKEVKPICNIPADAIRVKVRLRNDKPAMAYVKFENRVERWILAPKDGQAFDGPEWQLSLLQGVNFTTPPRAIQEIKERRAAFNKYP